MLSLSYKCTTYKKPFLVGKDHSLDYSPTGLCLREMGFTMLSVCKAETMHAGETFA